MWLHRKFCLDQSRDSAQSKANASAPELLRIFTSSQGSAPMRPGATPAGLQRICHLVLTGFTTRAVISNRALRSAISLLARERREERWSTMASTGAPPKVSRELKSQIPWLRQPVQSLTPLSPWTGEHAF